jgi:hypothetical protein
LVLGSHGDGDPANTETPLVAWGAGVRGPGLASPEDDVDDGLRFVDQHTHHEKTPASWGLRNVERTDVNQGDIAPLMVLCILMDMLLACSFFKKDCFPMFASLGCMSNQSFLVECNQGFGVLLFEGLFCFCVALAVNTFGSSMSFELSWDITSGVSCP